MIIGPTRANMADSILSRAACRKQVGFNVLGLDFLEPEKPKQVSVGVGCTDVLRSAQIWLNHPVPDGDRPLDRALAAGGGQVG